MLYLQQLIGLMLITLAHADSPCPVQLDPQRAVVRYNSSVSADCKTSVLHDGMGWEASEGAVPMREDSLITWTVSNLREWEILPFCFINYNVTQCKLDLPVTVYKTPDSVSINTVNHNGPMIDGNQYELECEVLNVAPVQNLIIKWYKGPTLVDQTTFNDTIKTPVNKTSELLIRPDRADDGAQYRCEAELELGEEGPQPPPKVTSDPLHITVYFKPIINETKLPSIVPVFRGFPGVIVCEAEGNPKPTISWNISTNDQVDSETLTITDSTPEDVYCIANNSFGTVIRHVKLSIQDSPCPVQLDPQRIVVRYNSSVSADCKTSVLHDGMGWEASEGAVPLGEDSQITWTVSNLREWDIKPHCLINYNDTQCKLDLPVTVYKTPDSVSINTVNHNGPMIDGNQYELQCEVLNVAPVQNLIIKWYKGPTLVDQTTFNDTIKTPVNETSELLIRPDRADDGAQYRCEAELELGEEGPQPPPKVTSDPLQITVYIKPIINEIKLPSIVPVFRGFPGVIVCEAEGNPNPTISWNISTNDQVDSKTLTINDSTPEDVYCIANNSVGTTIRHVKLSIQDSPCPVQLDPQRAVVRYDSSVSADCKTSVLHDGMGWEASEGAVPMREDSLITWRVPNLREWDIKPVCFMNYNDTQCTLDLPVTIYKTPDSVSINTVNHNGPMIDGNQYELQCEVLNVAPVQNLIIKWYKGLTLVDQTTFTDTIKTPVNKRSELLIRPDRADDRAQYRCEAELELGEEGPQPPPKVTSDHLHITVYYEPQIKHCQDWFPMTGTSLVFYPNVYSLVGNPRPNISWRRNSSLVNASILLNTIDSDQYEITASNELGDSKCIVSITVQYPPKLNCSVIYEVKEKTLFGMSCVVNGSPKPEVSLYRNGTIIQLPYYPNWNDSGWYTLTATNRHGTVNSTFFLNILYAPVLSAIQDKFVVVEDGNIVLECGSSGNPEPEMWLSFTNKNLSTGSRHITFKIERATSTSAGVYTCGATNKFGSKEKTFIVEIRAKSSNYIAIIGVAVTVFVLIIALFIYAWKRKKSTGRYQLQPANRHELRPLSKGGNS
ncbi:intercellular adhesion molecule 5 [Pseudorasbora parva]|uniref:intercellular adhesion molecule 5 n=1 Tax=Pseudorasbora parva TaxID=51549 RepID=UPI00351E227B